MTKEEMNEKIKEINRGYKLKRNAIYEEYALSNNPYKVGDILKDHYHIIRIEKIGYRLTLSGDPECIYTGCKLTKKLQPAKNQFDCTMVQGNVKEKMS